MRVVAGKFKGRKLKTPRGLFVRPTSDRVKEALFSIVGSEIRGANFLDLFAGTGSVGLEAFSRGAASVTFVEKDRIAVKILKQNLSIIENREDVKVLCSDVFRALKFLHSHKKVYNFIFMDPPYASNLVFQVLKGIEKYNLLCRGGFIIVERGKEEEIERHGDTEFRIINKKKYGSTFLMFYKHAL